MMNDATGQQTEPQAHFGWVARDADGSIQLFEKEPDYHAESGTWHSKSLTTSDLVGWFMDKVKRWPETQLPKGAMGLRRLLLAPVVSATGASTSGLNESASEPAMVGIGL